MSKSWYLYNESQLSGYEDEALDEYGVGGFLELLNSDLAYEVELYNYDLSEHSTIKVIIEGNISDTALKTLRRNILAQIGTCHAGQYIKYKNRFWLITGLVDDNKIYEKVIAVLCNYYLTWMNKEGKIIQRWANIASASQYNNGETTSTYYTFRSDQLMISCPNDEEVILLESGKRFVVDKRCEIYERKIAPEVQKDTSFDIEVFRLTRTDFSLFDYQQDGYAQFLIYQDEKREADGCYKINENLYWLCDVQDKYLNTNLHATIESDSDEIFNGIDYGIFTAKFYDNSGNIVSIEPNWEINSEFADKITVETINDSIMVSVNNKNLINKSFELSVSADGYEKVTKTIVIRAYI